LNNDDPISGRTADYTSLLNSLMAYFLSLLLDAKNNYFCIFYLLPKLRFLRPSK
jgi:hypothetical protein